jgi:hypothetical protein
MTQLLERELERVAPDEDGQKNVEFVGDAEVVDAVTAELDMEKIGVKPTVTTRLHH